MATLMECGHTAQGTSDSQPVCVICAHRGDSTATTVAVVPDLTGRMAHCSAGCPVVPSSTDLAFFQYRGPGSRAATDHCGAQVPRRGTTGTSECCMHVSVHQPINPHTGRDGITDHEFVEREPMHDMYYCGCRGWD